MSQQIPPYQPPETGPTGPQPSHLPTGPSLSPTEERNLGMLSHALPLGAMILSAGFLGFVASLVLYLMYKDRGPFVRAHAANSLNVQIITGIVLLVSLPLMLVLVGFATYGIAIVVACVLHIIGAVRASNGEWWQPPMTPRFVR